MDNNPNKKTPDGSDLLTFDDIKEFNTNDFAYIIANSGANAIQISLQLQDLGYLNYITYEDFYMSLTDKRAPAYVESIKKAIVKSYSDVFANNNRSQVEFYLVDSFEIFHYLPIYKAFINAGIKSEIVAEPPGINTAGEWFDYKTATNILNKLGISYSNRANPNAKIAITTQFSRNLSEYRGIKIQLAYGNAPEKDKDFQAFPEVTKGFDYCWVHGLFKKKIMSNIRKTDSIKIIGYPKYIEFYKNKPSKQSIMKELGIKTDKPILCYYPTWDEYSSIQEYGEFIAKLKHNFFVITKPHHCTYRLPEKKEDLSMIYHISDLVLDGNYNLAKITQIADFALCDAKSGVFSEIPYYKRDIKMAIIYANGLTPNNLYYEMSKLCCGIYSPKEIFQVVNELYKCDNWRNDRKKMVDYFIDSDSEKDLEDLVSFVKGLL